jgi:hypothetical protein
MKTSFILGVACLVICASLRIAGAEPYVSEEFPPKEILAYNYDQQRKWLGFSYFKTLNVQEPADDGWYSILIHYNWKTPLGDRDSTTTLNVKRLQNNTWIMRGDGIKDIVLELVEEEPPPQ